MTNKLAENIRAFRKQRLLTQEQLAEVLGVTTGAVYKWEAKLSQPELSMLMELADFFDTSVDVLLGYEMKDNRLAASVARIQQCRREKDRDGFDEAEKALKKYPNVFDVAYNSAVLYSSLGIECGDKPMLLRYGAAAAKPAAHCAEYGSGNKRKHHTRHYGGGIALPWGCGAGGGDAEKA